ncbi:hypothetical protein GCK72_001964 [Caenorhabditis remanei]|uniref:Alanine--glyoxylate aminotransferase 2, mitochondrial n=1 Tax=Caenorhabditis remanei TaxID=31234 RepID=A0A6A5HTQ6_CAERE|nr:hypothetical protein GCK72_001964 [Caenorhabditis remanei]KAF1770146.1 hypothetical protein GCK72_001964 [Caenorhabditis remanei]
MQRVQQLRPLLPKGHVTYYKDQLLIVKGEKQFLFDSNGKKYLDFFGGIVTVSVGHCHPKVNAALTEQAQKLWHTTSIYHTEPIYEYAEKLIGKFPSKLNSVFFVNSGSEANDLALALARNYTGRFDVISMRNGYHGMTQTVLGATNLGNWKPVFPHGFNIFKSLNADPYRGIFGGSNCRDSPIQVKNRKCGCAPGVCEASDKYIEQFEEMLLHDFSHSSGPAAFLIESIQGVGGTVQYPHGYLKKSYEAVQKRGGLAIADEVQTGFGRLGSHFWGFESQDALPDMVTMAKGIGNGFPLGAVVTTKEIADSFNKSLYFNTYGGNPLASVVGKAVLEVIEEEKLQENCAVVGDYFLKQLAALDEKAIGDVRGKGLMIGVELIDEQGKPLAAAKTAAIFEDTKNHGLLIGKGGIHGNVLRIKPPMCITKEDVDFAVDIIAKSIKQFK